MRAITQIDRGVTETTVSLTMKEARELPGMLAAIVPAMLVLNGFYELAEGGRRTTYILCR